MKIVRMLVLLAGTAAVSVSGSVHAAAGKSGIAEVCFECHGPDNVTSDPLVPKLNGQLRSFLVKQTMYYVTGARQDTVMSEVVAKLKLTADDISEIADFYSRLPPMKGSGVTTALGRKGREIFVSQKCIFCHNEIDRTVPTYIGETVIVGGQNREYLIKSMLDLRNRARSADDFDLMGKTVEYLSQDDIEAVAEFLGSL